MDLLAIFPTLAGFLITGMFGKHIGDKGSQFVCCVAVLISAVASVVMAGNVILMHTPWLRFLGEWFSSGDLSVVWALRFDQLSVIMMCVVTVISACVHIYSIGYMARDPSRTRFFAYLNLFTFAMLMLVTSDNLLQLFFGWEGVGLTSYLLIGFWYPRNSAGIAANKAFIVNRIGDAAFLLGIFAIYLVFGSVDFDDIFDAAPELAGSGQLNMIGLLLFIGAMGKSAQLGLHTWLPDAMEGPTPVSALIHAATMVTAGVFLIARFSPLYEYTPDVRTVICVTGALTAFMGATIALTKLDIKQVIAYSTISQLGYMFFALGISAYSAAMFHLVTHAFFKALLFLGAGSVIHAMSGEQDMRKMGGIWKIIPASYVIMWIGALALSGMPFFAGFYSKDIILEAAWADGTWFGTFAFWLGIIAAFLTALYSWRMLLLTFHGEQRADDKVMAHIHESPNSMMMPLTFLAMGAIFIGSFLYGGFVGETSGEVIVRNGQEYVSIWNSEYFWGESIKVLPRNDSVAAAHHSPFWIKSLPVLVALAGIFVACFVYYWKKGIAERMASLYPARPIYLFLSRRWYFDAIYELVFVRLLKWLGSVLATIVDPRLIDQFGPGGVVFLSRKISEVCSNFQTGNLYHYAFIMIAGLIALVSWMFVIFGAGY